jgi:hypothetical protein
VSNNSQAAPRQRAAKIPEPIEVHKFWANRRGEAVIVALREYQGIALIDVRKHYTAADGCLRPTAKGIGLSIRKLPDLAAAVAKALERARVLGLLEEDDAR